MRLDVSLTLALPKCDSYNVTSMHCLFYILRSADYNFGDKDTSNHLIWAYHEPTVAI